MEIKLTFLGDIMCEDTQIKECSLGKGKYDFSKIFDKSVTEILNESDYVIGNLETPIAGEKLKYSNQLYSFNTPNEFLGALKKIGIDVLSTANNHCLDRGVEGLLNTMNALEKANIKYTGTNKSKNENRILVLEINGIKLAILSYTYGTNAAFNNCYLRNDEKYMVNLFREQETQIGKYHIFRRLKRKIRHINIKNSKILDYTYLKKLRKDIKEAKEKSDFVIMCMHSGGQYNDIVDEYTAFLGEYLINNGVNFVIGAHPHVVHNSYMNEQNFCAYSLGNFACTPWKYEGQKDNLPDYSIVLNIYINSEKKKISKISFSIAKSVLDSNGFSKVFMVDEIMKNSNENELIKINNEVEQIIEKFTNKKREELEKDKREFIIYRGE